MPGRPRRPNLDEPFTLPDDTDPDEVLRRLLEGSETTTVSDEPDEDPEDG